MNDEQYVYDDDEYAYEAEAGDGNRRRIWMAIGVVAALLLACLCVICITAAVIVYLNTTGPAEPAPTAAPPPVSEGEVLNTTWLWTHLFETAPGDQSVVPNPENYLLVFRPNGQFQVKADCNVGAGAYAVSGNSVSLLLGPLTMAECGPQSLSNQYLALLNNVSTWNLVDGRLVLNLEDGSGHMDFANGGPAEPAPVPSPEVTSTPTPPAPEPTPTTEVPQPTPTTNPAAGLIGPAWKWSELIEGQPASQTLVPNPESYTLTFFNDATLAFLSDCNSGGGTYLVQGNSLMLELAPLTLVECGPGSLSNQYVELLGTVVSFGFDADRLLLHLADGVSHMVFVP
jgi:heat shock protein HslJ